MEPGSRPRVAVVGGDARVERIGWPPDVEVRHFQASKYDGSSGRRLLAGIANGSYDAVIVLTRWIDHPLQKLLTASQIKLVYWGFGAPRLARELPTLLKQRL